MVETEIGLSLKQDVELSRGISYERYHELGGVIGEGDYQRVLTQARQTTHLKESLIAQAEAIAQVAGFTLDNFRNSLDAITILYGVLRTDFSPGGQNHYSLMGDQRLFAEALKILDHPDLLAKVTETHSYINFG